jgi:hypothetical protein
MFTINHTHDDSDVHTLFIVCRLFCVTLCSLGLRLCQKDTGIGCVPAGHNCRFQPIFVAEELPDGDN